MSAKKLPQFVAGLSAAFGAFCLGAAIGWSAPAESAVLGGDYGFEVSHLQFSWVGALLTFGAAFICVPIGFLISLIGRKPTMLALIPPFLIGWLLLIVPQNVFMLYIGRFIIGMCGGAFCVTAPMYTTEISQIELRGVMGCFFQLLIVNGVLYGFVVGCFFNLKKQTVACAILPILFFIIFMWMPESPVYHVQKGNPEKAEKSLKWLRGADYDTSAEMAEMQAANAKSDEGKHLKETFFRKATLKGLLIAISLMMFQQITGINAIIFYSTAIFYEAGTGIRPELSTIIVGVIMVFATLISILLVEKVGRRILLLVSALFMGISTCVMGVYFQLRSRNADSIGWLPVITICVFIVAFSIGFGPVPWLMIAELFAEEVKGVAGSIAGTSSWVIAFLVVKMFPILNRYFGAAPTFWIFTIAALLAIIFVWLLVPETKGKTLAEIQAELGGDSK